MAEIPLIFQTNLELNTKLEQFRAGINLAPTKNIVSFQIQSLVIDKDSGNYRVMIVENSKYSKSLYFELDKDDVIYYAPLTTDTHDRIYFYEDANVMIRVYDAGHSTNSFKTIPLKSYFGNESIADDTSSPRHPKTIFNG